MQIKDGKIFIIMFNQIFIWNLQYNIINYKNHMIILNLLVKIVNYKIHSFKDDLLYNE